MNILNYDSFHQCDRLNQASDDHSISLTIVTCGVNLIRPPPLLAATCKAVYPSLYITHEDDLND
jgi:hypothetical protein